MIKIKHMCSESIVLNWFGFLELWIYWFTFHIQQSINLYTKCYEYAWNNKNSLKSLPCSFFKRQQNQSFLFFQSMHFHYCKTAFDTLYDFITVTILSKSLEKFSRYHFASNNNNIICVVRNIHMLHHARGLSLLWMNYCY